MRVLFCTSEAVPFAKTGGLADVSGALPQALSAAGVDVRVVLPRYGTIALDGLERLGSVDVDVAGAVLSGTVYRGQMPRRHSPREGSGHTVEVWFVDRPEYFDRPELYGDGGRDYADSLARFAFFSRAVLQWTAAQRWRPDVIHCNDWQSALIPAVIAAGQAPAAATLLTVHNLAYQGLFPAAEFSLTGLPPSLFTMAAMEFWGQVNVLKGGIVFSTLLSTVSETYAEEIQTPEFGAGLDGVLRDRRSDLFGILNGVDYGVWDPSVDPLIPARYTRGDLRGKAECKRALQQAFGVQADGTVPLLGMVTRLVDQKGLDLVAAVIEDVLAAGAQLVLLGTGEPAYHQRFGDLAAALPQSFGVRLGFDNRLAHLIEAGADMFLMPSRYEPSGLNQLYSLRYGTVPIVRRTGGLADSIVDATPAALAGGTANGFVFVDYAPDALLDAIRRALETFRAPDTWRRIQKNGMRADFSWSASAQRYLVLYELAAMRPTQTAPDTRG
ncbi:MAG TPA: glycogen synthase GlgA [bacterium]|nr:glycogen synthase GlgA [bacterium]